MASFIFEKAPFFGSLVVLTLWHHRDEAPRPSAILYHLIPFLCSRKKSNASPTLQFPSLLDLPSRTPLHPAFRWKRAEMQALKRGRW